MSAPTLPAGVIQDGTMPVGTQVVTINGVAYILNRGSIKRTSSSVVRKTAMGLPGDETLFLNQFTGDAELQLADWDTVVPPIGAEFPIKAAGQVTLHAKVTEASDAFEQMGEWKCNISFNQKLHPTA